MRFGGLIAAVVFAAIAAVVVLRMSGGSSDTPANTAVTPASKSVNVYVATKPLPVGTTITETDIGAQPWPENLILDGFVQADGKTNLVGMVTRAQLMQNEPITLGKVANPNDPNFLAGDLPKGMRVVTIPVTETDGVAGFVFPGDHVDLIYTHDVPRWESPPKSAGASSRTARPTKVMTTVTETLLTNVKVGAIDQRSSATGAVDSKGNLIIPRSASLIVSATDSQRVRLAQHTGTVSLVLRALADKESADPLVLTGPEDISQNKTEAAGEEDSVNVLRGAAKTPEEAVSVEDADPVAVTRGAAGVSGSTSAGAGGPVGALPSGSSVVTPGLAAF